MFFIKYRVNWWDLFLSSFASKLHVRHDSHKSRNIIVFGMF